MGYYIPNGGKWASGGTCVIEHVFEVFEVFFDAMYYKSVLS